MTFRKRIEQFQRVDFAQNKEEYQSLRGGQDPHTLFITCSDSRIDVERLLQAKPGEIFHLRNIANIVTPENEMNDYPSIISTIEYGVKVLNVDNIAVCGHSNCGGCAALMNWDEKRNDLPITAKWLEVSLPIKKEVVEKYSDYPIDEQAVILEKANTLAQLNHLMTYSFIEERVKEESLNLYALYYDIGSGQVFEYKYDQDMLDLLSLVRDLDE